MQRQGDRRSYREDQELQEPFLLRPKWGDEGQKGSLASPKFGEHLANKGE